MLWNFPQINKTATATNHLDSPTAAPSAGPSTPSSSIAEAAFDLVVPMGCPALAIHTHAGLCALWLQSAASSSGNLHKPAKPKPPQPPCTAPLPQPPVQAPPPLLHTAEAAFHLAVPHGMPRAGHSHTGRAQCAVVAECCLLLWKSPHTGKTATPLYHLPSPAAVPKEGSTTPSALSKGCI